MTPAATRFARARLLLPLGILSALALAAAVAAWPGTARTASAVTCTGGLIAQVRQGPDHGLTLQGRYSVRISPSGSFAGSLATATGSVPMTGQALGRAVNWIFALSGGRHLYVAGTSLEPLKTCTAANEPHFWGVATGPRFGDLGVWADTSRNGKVRDH